jgi:hypothetical protein
LPSRQPQGPSHVRVNATGPGSVFSLITGAWEHTQLFPVVEKSFISKPMLLLNCLSFTLSFFLSLSYTHTHTHTHIHAHVHTHSNTQTWRHSFCLVDNGREKLLEMTQPRGAVTIFWSICYLSKESWLRTQSLHWQWKSDKTQWKRE